MIRNGFPLFWPKTPLRKLLTYFCIKNSGQKESRMWYKMIQVSKQHLYTFHEFLRDSNFSFNFWGVLFYQALLVPRSSQKAAPPSFSIHANAFSFTSGVGLPTFFHYASARTTQKSGSSFLSPISSSNSFNTFSKASWLLN